MTTATENPQPTWWLVELGIIPTLVFIGGKDKKMRCALTGRLSKNNAHTHVVPNGRSFCICIGRHFWQDDYPTPTMLHEIAHVRTPHDTRHGPDWSKEFAQLLHDWGYAIPDKKVTEYSGHKAQLVNPRKPTAA